MASSLKENSLSIILLTAPLIQLMIFTFGIYSTDNAIVFVIPMVLVALFALLGIYLIIKKKDERIGWEKIFLYIVIVCAVCIICLNPPMMAPDEVNHFYRAYSLSEGKIWAENVNGVWGNYLPDNINPEVGVWGQTTVNTDIFRRLFFDVMHANETFVYEGNTLVYFPTSYLPQAIGIFVSRIINMSVYWIIFFGRLANCICYTTLCYYAIKFIADRYKCIMSLMALLPIALYEGCSLSTDSVIISASFLFISLALRDDMYKNRKKLDVIMYILGFVVVLGKFTYLSIMFLPWLGNLHDKKKIKANIIYDISLIVSIIIWNLFIMLTIQNIGLYDTNISPIDQVIFILTNLFKFMATVATTTLKKLPIYFVQLFCLGWLDHIMYALVFIYPFVILFICFAKTDEQSMFTVNRKGRLFYIFMIILSSVVLIHTALYITWTPVGLNEIWGVQGRYLVPVMPLLMILIKELFAKIKFSFKTGHERKTALISAIGPLYMIIYLGITYWVKYINM